MSLQVWLPLNGSLDNLGLSGTKAVNHNATTNSNGKIGKCYQNTASNYITIPVTIDVKQPFSLCYWYRIDTWNNWGTTITLNAANQDYLGMCTHSDGTRIGTNWYEYRNGNSTRIFDSYHNNTIIAGQWNHIVITFDGTNNIKTYIDGSLVSNGTVEIIPLTNFTELTLFRRGHFADSAYSSMNDVRVYDHCLSAKEVKEIAKGLVCHYPLKSQYETGQVNKYSGDVAEGYLTGGFTRTKLEGERGYNYKLSYTGTGDDMWYALHPDSTFPFTVGKRYYYSCKVRCHSTNFSLSLRASRSYNDWVTNMTNVLAKADGEWHEYVVSQVINETYDRSGSTETCNPILEFYTNNLKTSGTVYSADFDIKDVQVIESDCYVPFIDNSMASTVVSDCSGYGNNGTKVGNIAWSSDSPRYNGSYDFNGTNYIKTNYSASVPELSCSFWVKPNSQNGEYAIIASNYNNPSSGFWIAINCEGSGLWFYNGAYVRANSLLSNDVWYHGCFTYNKGVAKWYLNGELVTTTDISSRGTSLTISNLSIGNSYTGSSWNTKFYGGISDFRLYATALSAEDVKSLYNVSASIDKTGVLSAYEFVEEG